MQEKKVWLTKDQVEEMQKSCERLKDRVIVKLGAWVGLRSNEISNASVTDLRQSHIKGEVRNFLHVEGKRTQQDKGQNLKKDREAYLPDHVHSDLIMLKNEKGLTDDDPLIPNKFGNRYRPDGIRKRVYTISEKAYERTGDEDFKDVSSHDLRRFFAHYHLVEQRKNPRVIMDIGGWKNWSAIKPYLDKPSKSTIVDEME